MWNLSLDICIIYIQWNLESKIGLQKLWANLPNERLQTLLATIKSSENEEQKQEGTMVYKSFSMSPLGQSSLLN